MVYGGVGLGKTHIVQAIGNYVNSNHKADRVLYVSSEQFTSQFVRSIQANRVSDFSNFYRQIDLLIVDDVQFFGGKEKTQEEFFHVFNELHQSGKQIILCADRPPAEISGIEERLLSRFKWGLSADIQVPDLETRIAILQYKAAQHNVSLSPDVVDFVAERVKANIRQLEGALLKLSAHSSIYRREIDPEAAKEILRDMMDDFQVRLEIEDIQRAVAQFYSLTPELLSAKTRKREVVTARHIAMYFSKQMTSHSLKSIGLRFGGRDHSTVIHACNSVEDRVKLEPAFREEFTEIEQLLQRQSPPRPARMRRQQVGMA
jgi:chromosomal replication initiator protein